MARTVLLLIAALIAYIYAKPISNDDVGYFWHFSDTHIYPEYKEGTNPLTGFCRTLKGKTGKYGNYNCDSPLALMESAVDVISHDTGKPDFVLYGGDHISIFDTTQTETMAIHRLCNVSDYLRNIRRSLGNINVYPVIGNHDVVPQFQMPETGPFYVYSTVAEQWSTFVSPESVKTLNHSAYYTELIRPGLRIVALNTVLFYKENLRVSRSVEDPAGQFAWFRGVMDAARKNGERVIVTSHIPPGSEMWEEFVKKYVEVFKGYNDIIVAAFYGHHHYESYRIVKDSEGGSHVAFLTSSLTPKYLVNPTITVYKFKKTAPFTILDRIPYYVNITDSEITGKINWINSGSEAAEYGLNDMSVESMTKLEERMESDDTLFQKFYDRIYAYARTKCGSRCKREVLCTVKYPIISEYKKCMEDK